MRGTLRTPVVLAAALLAVGAVGGVVVLRGGTTETPERCEPAAPVRGTPLEGLSGERVYFNGARNGLRYAVGEATIGTRAGVPNEILAPRPGRFDADIAKDPYVVRVRDRLYLYYSGYSYASDRWAIGLATSADDGRTWRRRRGAVVGPYRIDADSQPFPVVVPPRHGGRWTMLIGESAGIYRHSSRDGVHWTRRTQPVLRRHGEAGLTPGELRRQGSRWMLLYGAGTRRGWEMRVAYGSRADGPFAPAGRVLQRGAVRARFRLRRPVAPGGRRLELRPRRRSTGRFLAVIAGKRGWQLVHVAGVDARGAARMKEPAAQRYDAGTLVTAVTTNSVTPEYLAGHGRRAVLLATAFRLLPGCLVELSLVGRLHREGTHTAVVWDWDASPLVPVGAPNSWNSNSTENPVLIRVSR